MKNNESVNHPYKVTVTGRHVHITESMKQYVLDKIAKMEKLSHKIIEGGRFQEAYQKMDDSLALPWRVFVEGDKDEEPKSKKVKTKYSCSSCGSNVWGKPEMLIRCGICEDFPLYLPV